ncbi:MFS transporter [Salinarchaeum laminariae]|uniref:MFS transporter n=1 Tax=Salinarchaeum laminariae TaxID=869888 RepID=UPI0020C1152B|nr:MFS transporter [Salinarchaeum laminariae]
MHSEDRRVVGTAAASHALVHAHELSIPILISVWLAEYSVTPALLGVVATVAYGCFGAGALPAGVLADRVGASRLIGASLLGSGGAFLLVGGAGWLPLENVAPLGVPGPVWAIALALAIWGVAASAYHPSGLTLLSTAVEQRGRGFALHGAAGNVGIATGPLLTILLLELVSWQTVAVVLGVGAIVVGLSATVLDVDTATADATTNDGAATANDDATAADDSATANSATADQDAETAPDGGDATADASSSLRGELQTIRSVLGGPFLVVLAIVIASGLYYRGALTFLPEILADLDWLTPIDVGSRELPAARLVYVGVLAVGVVGQLVGGRLSDTLEPSRGIAAAFLGLAILAVAFPIASAAGAVPLLVVAALLGGALFVVQPLYQAAVAEFTPEAARGASYGLTYLCVFGIGALGGALAGGLLTVATAEALFFGLAAIAGVAALLAGGLATGRLGGA